MAGRVISGKYANCAVYCDSERMYVFIKKNDKSTIPLEPETVQDYKMIQRNALAGRQLYSVIWQDGSKSVVGIPEAWQTYLASGCEVGRLDNKTVRENKRQKRKGFFGGIAVAGLLLIVFAYLLTPHKPKDVIEGTYAEWDGKGPKDSSAEVLVETTDAIGLPDGTGAVSGYFYNESIRTFRHVEVIYSLYDQNAEKVGQCLFSTNKAQFKSGTPLEFTAACDNWGENPTVVLESVGFRTSSLGD